MKTFDTFLDENKHLSEVKDLLDKGIDCPGTVHGKRLNEYLVRIKSDRAESSAPKLSTCTQTEYFDEEPEKPSATSNVDPCKEYEPGEIIPDMPFYRYETKRFYSDYQYPFNYDCYYHEVSPISALVFYILNNQ